MNLAPASSPITLFLNSLFLTILIISTKVVGRTCANQSVPTQITASYGLDAKRCLFQFTQCNLLFIDLSTIRLNFQYLCLAINIMSHGGMQTPFFLICVTLFQ